MALIGILLGLAVLVGLVIAAGFAFFLIGGVITAAFYHVVGRIVSGFFDVLDRTFDDD